MDSVAYAAIQAVNVGQLAYCKFLSANDTGDTGGHQSGIYIAKNAVPILFDAPGVRGENKKKHVKIRWQEDFSTDSDFTYYGQGTRNEYRITRFGRGFPFLRTEHTGDLFVFVKNDDDNYSAYILETEEEIESFLAAFALSPADTGAIIPKSELTLDARVELVFSEFIQTLTVDFPPSVEMSAVSRRIFHDIFDHQENITQNPDGELLSWIEMEYRLFRKIEFSRYGDFITRGFASVE